LPVSGCDDPCDCNDSADWVNPGHAETCDNYDNNCDSQVDEGCDDDGDDYCDENFLFYNYPVAVCPLSNLVDGSDGDDCDDLLDTINPGISDVCNGIDDDCDGSTADGSAEIPPLNTLQLGVCAGTNQACIGGAWQDSYPGTYEATEVSCGDNQDNDCDGLEDCFDPDCECNCIFTLTLPCDFL